MLTHYCVSAWGHRYNHSAMYLFVEYRTTYDEALVHCVERGGVLTSVTTTQEFDFMVAHIAPRFD